MNITAVVQFLDRIAALQSLHEAVLERNLTLTVEAEAGDTLALATVDVAVDAGTATAALLGAVRLSTNSRGRVPDAPGRTQVTCAQTVQQCYSRAIIPREVGRCCGI